MAYNAIIGAMKSTNNSDGTDGLLPWALQIKHEAVIIAAIGTKIETGNLTAHSTVIQFMISVIFRIFHTGTMGHTPDNRPNGTMSARNV